MGSSIPRSGHQTCCGTEERASLASVSTIVVVAGQTQVHMVTLATVRPAIVPPIVPEPIRTGACGSRATGCNPQLSRPADEDSGQLRSDRC
jgi:hypothetical protein